MINRLTTKSDITELPMSISLKESCSEDSCSDICQLLNTNCHECPIQKCITKLSKYEDTGLTPEEIHNLILSKYNRN